MIRFLQTPTRTKKFVLGGMLVVICLLMVITLIPGIGTSDFFGGNTQGTLAHVGSQAILTSEVQAAARNLGRRQFPRGVPEMLQPYLMQSAANNLILQKALENEASRMGLRVSDAELQEQLQKGQFGEIFFPGGKFIGQDQYADIVSQNFGMSITQFEEAVKSQLLITKLQGAVSSGVAVSDSELQKAFDRQNTKVKLQYAIINSEDLKNQIKPTDAELKTFYDQNKARYQNSIPEQRKASYILMDASKIADTLKAGIKPDQLQKYYTDHKEEYKTPEEVKASHILIRTPPPGPDGKPDQKAIDAAKAKAEDILKQVRNGGDFAAIAKKESQDPGSAAKGGDLGWFQRGAMVAEFDKAAFSQPIGKIGDIVQTSFGFHIIKVEAKHDAGYKPFDQVKDEIAKKLTQEEATKQSTAQANKLLDEARKDGMAKAAAQNHVDLTNSNWFSRTDSLAGVGAAPDFMTAVFDAKANDAPQIVKITGIGAGGAAVDRYAVVQVTAVKPPETPTFETIKDKVTNDYKTMRVSQMLTQKTQELADRAHAEHDLKKAAAEAGAKVMTTDLVSPSSPVADLGSLTQGPAAVALDLKAGEISGALNLGARGAVLQVVDKQQPGADEFAKQRDTLRDQILQQKQQTRMQMFVAGLRQRMEKEGKIKINREEWTRVMGSAPDAS